MSNWRKTGWHASNRGGYVIRWELCLPGGSTAQIDLVRKRWRVTIDHYERIARYRSAEGAKRAAEKVLLSHLRLAIKELA